MRTKFWLESLKERDHSEDPDGRIILKWTPGNGWRVWFVSIRVRISTVGVLL
jgi:hypothetical protein